MRAWFRRLGAHVADVVLFDDERGKLTGPAGLHVHDFDYEGYCDCGDSAPVKLPVDEQVSGLVTWASTRWVEVPGGIAPVPGPANTTTEAPAATLTQPGPARVRSAVTPRPHAWLRIVHLTGVVDDGRPSKPWLWAIYPAGSTIPVVCKTAATQPEAYAVGCAHLEEQLA